uniref:Putative secreted peptide n=1 Tax=Anopheles braziliensis TaxID=58242 RepID=A0A2M3ZRJ9_9DIPT
MRSAVPSSGRALVVLVLVHGSLAAHPSLSADGLVVAVPVSKIHLAASRREPRPLRPPLLPPPLRPARHCHPVSPRSSAVDTAVASCFWL